MEFNSAKVFNIFMRIQYAKQLNTKANNILNPNHIPNRTCKSAVNCSYMFQNSKHNYYDHHSTRWYVFVDMFSTVAPKQ